LCFTKQCKNKQDAIDAAEELSSRKVVEDNYVVKQAKNVRFVDKPILTDDDDVLLDRDAVKIAEYK